MGRVRFRSGKVQVGSGQLCFGQLWVGSGSGEVRPRFELGKGLGRFSFGYGFGSSKFG